MRKAVGSIYTANALSQEKTGGVLVDGQLFGRPRCHTTGDFEHAEVGSSSAKNPWQSHGFPRGGRSSVRSPPTRAHMIVIGPASHRDRRARDIPLQVKPAWTGSCS